MSSQRARGSHHLGHLLRLAQQTHNRLWATQVSGAITSPQSSILWALMTNPDVDQVTATRLAHLDRSTGAELIERLSRQGLIERRRDSADQRRYLLRLTTEGRALRDSLAPSIDALHDQLLELVDPELRPAFLNALEQLVERGERTDEA